MAATARPQIRRPKAAATFAAACAVLLAGTGLEGIVGVQAAEA